MGIYSNKIFREEVTPDDVINTPDEIGIELDTIEKAICGPDGIEGHRDEIEDAATGVVGEPLEEAFNIIYESEYNYNQILRCIGMNELKSFVEGKEYVFTEADKNGFFETFRKWLLEAFRKVTEWFNKMVNKFREATGLDKKFVEKHSKEIVDGYNAIAAKGDTKFETYDFSNLIENVADAKNDKFFSYADPNNHVVDANLDIIHVGDDDVGYQPSASEREAESLKRMGVTALVGDDTTMDNLNERLTSYARGEKKTVTIGENKDLTADNVIKRMKQDFVGGVQAIFKEIKNNFHKRIEKVDKMRRECSKENDEGVVAKKLAVCERYMADMRHDLRVENIKSAIYISAISARATRDRILAKKYYTAGKKEEKPAEETPKTESAPIGSVIFSSMKFV